VRSIHFEKEQKNADVSDSEVVQENKGQKRRGQSMIATLRGVTIFVKVVSKSKASASAFF